MKKAFEVMIDEKVICSHMIHARTFSDRLVGLMFSKEMSGFDGLMITPCRSIHTLFMRYPIDVVFLSKDLKVVHLIRSLSPWRLTGIYFRAYQVLELPAGRLDNSISRESKVELKCIS